MRSPIAPAIANAYKVLDGEDLTEQEALQLTEVAGCDILDLVSLANKVRDRFAPGITPCSIINAKSGACSQNCRFCAQAACHRTGVDVHPLLDADEIVRAAQEVYRQGVRTFGIVTSGLGFQKADSPDFRSILDTMDRLRRELPDLHVCLSLGLLSEETAQALQEHGAYRYNINLQTNPQRYGQLIATTHTIEDKMDTIRLLQRHHIGVCSGGILGLGETWADRVRLALACRELDVDVIPLNVLIPIPGTPLEDQPTLAPHEVAKTFAIVRLLNPRKAIKFAAGRETAMKDFQALLMLAGMNSLITGGYLTTRGRAVADDERLIGSLAGFTTPETTP